MGLEPAKNGMIIAGGFPSTPTRKGANTMTIDPVCGMDVDENNPEFVTKFAGKKYVFCSENCQKDFEEQPEDYVETAA